MINIALPKGRLGLKVYKLFETAEYEFPEIMDNKAIGSAVYLGLIERGGNND